MQVSMCAATNQLRGCLFWVNQNSMLDSNSYRTANQIDSN